MGRLHAKRVRKVRRPDYPTKREVEAVPGLLAAHVPSAWLSREDLGKALGVFLAASLIGCIDGEASGAGAKRATPRGPAIVPPIFAHGNGHALDQGMFGNTGGAGPVFLSEAEALQIIAQELRAQGIEMTRRDVVLSSVVIRGRHIESGYDWLANRHSADHKTSDAPLTADLADEDRRIVVEYVAEDDFDPLGGAESGLWPGNIKGVAQSVAQAVARDGRDMYFGALYDPIVWSSSRGVRWSPAAGSLDAQLEEEFRATAEAQHLLRLQVKDFVDWLKAQGAI